MKINKFIISLFFITSLTAVPSGAESLKQIDYYGIASRDAEKNMLSMTENLFFTQLQEQNLNISDKRSNSFSKDYFNSPESVFQSDKSDIFYAIISKKENEKWELKLNFIKTSGKNRSITKEYDSYYKILMESKSSINTILNDLINIPSIEPGQSETPAQISTVNLEKLAGIWSGDQFMAKIVLMKVGRGFIVFKNGATMNISINISKDDNSIQIEQTSGNNASYFPELERKAALELAIDAKPITWTFQSFDGKSLSGKKKTLLQDNSGVISEKEISTVWNKISQ